MLTKPSASTPSYLRIMLHSPMSAFFFFFTNDCHLLPTTLRQGSRASGNGPCLFLRRTQHLTRPLQCTNFLFPQFCAVSIRHPTVNTYWIQLCQLFERII